MRRLIPFRFGVLLGAVPMLGGCSDPAPPPEASCPVEEISGVAPDDPQVFNGLALGALGTSCGLVNDGSVWCWGQLGWSGSTFPNSQPGAVDGVSNAVALAFGDFQACAIRGGGSVVCWAYEPPAPVSGICGASSLSAGGFSSCAVVADGSVRCWGSLQEAVFGEGAAGGKARKVPNVSEAITVAMGANGYACALLSSGEVACWGGGPRTNRPGIEPTAVPEISGATAVSGTPISLGNEMCAVLSDGSVTCWTHARAPALVPELEGVVSVAVGYAHACALLEDKSVRCWGSNGSGELGDGTLVDSETPVTVVDLASVRQVAVGGESIGGHSCALLEDGSARCWGENRSGQLGNGDTISSATPVPVLFP